MKRTKRTFPHSDRAPGDIIAAASPSCGLCAGSGLRKDRRTLNRECSCAFRRIFRAVFERYRLLAEMDTPITTSIETEYGADNEMRWKAGQCGRTKRAEFRADVSNVARRTLTPEELRVFEVYHIADKSWSNCLQRMPVIPDKGTFYHAVYRVEERLGRAFLEHRLYPTSRY